MYVEEHALLKLLNICLIMKQSVTGGPFDVGPLVLKREMIVILETVEIPYHEYWET